VTRFPGGPHRAMNRWIAFSAAGDALTPLFVAAAYLMGGTHKSALAVVALLLALQALGTFRATRYNAAGALNQDNAEPVVPLRTALASAARQRKMWLFLFGASACTLLDEIVVALAALRLQGDLGWSTGLVAAALTSFSLGGVAGAVASDRLLSRCSPRALLIGASLGSVGFLALFIAAPNAPAAALALLVLGMTASLHYPLVKASAFELMPGQPGVVNAIAQAFVGMEIVLPLVIGAIAAQYGLAAALAALAIEPIVLLFVAACWHTQR
jgi:predicted MFS family arabinose efflux permease